MPEDFFDSAAPAEPAEAEIPEEQVSPSPEPDISEDVKAFAAEFPDAAADPEAIPTEVWERVTSGESLVNAYRRWTLDSLTRERDELKTALRRLEQEQQNRLRSTGSQQSLPATEDEFDQMWYD